MPDEPRTIALDPGPRTTDPTVPMPGAVDVELQLRWGDMDVNAHVNNVQFARLIEEGRVRAFRRWFSGGAIELSVLVARQDIEFRAPLYYTADPVVVRLAVAHLGTSSFTIGATITAADGTVAAVARTTMVLIDPATGNPTAIPSTVRESLESSRADMPGLRPSR